MLDALESWPFNWDRVEFLAGNADYQRKTDCCAPIHGEFPLRPSWIHSPLMNMIKDGVNRLPFRRSAVTLTAMFFGAHMPTSGGVSKALERGTATGCEVVQIFVKNNLQWFGKPYAADELKRFTDRGVTHPFRCVFGHAGYLINLAAPPSPKRDLSLRSLIEEVQLAASLSLPFLVLHPGSHVGTGEAEGLRAVVQGLDEVIAATKSCRVRIALEITSGQGSCLGHKIEHLAEIYQQVKRPKRLGICLDTAHLFAAGFDLRLPKVWDSAVEQFDAAVGLKEILAIHLNDSKADLGSRVDRHAGIGQGKIGREAFRRIVNDPRFAELPGCLETPKSADLHEDLENLAVLRSLLASAKRR